VLDRTCSVPSCSRTPASRGWCHAHYARWTTSGNVRADEPIRQLKNSPTSWTCKVDGCDRGAVKSQMCTTHAYRKIRLGDPGPAIDIRRCSRDDCDLKHFGRGLCRLHWGRQHRLLRAVADRPACSEVGCDLPTKHRGFCNAHYQRHVALGDLPWTRPEGAPPCSMRGCLNRSVNAEVVLCPRHARNSRNGRGMPEPVCKKCGTDFPASAGAGKRYCEPCADANHKAATKAHQGRRRAVERDSSSEQFFNHEIFERDGWKCGICRKRVNRRLKYPHLGSATLDHVLPVSLGGAHTRANVQLAHWGCNHRKNNRGGGEQLALVG
jgi:5-methylcytosine-specific restriction endonuclease McrA